MKKGKFSLFLVLLILFLTSCQPKISNTFVPSQDSAINGQQSNQIRSGQKKESPALSEQAPPPEHSATIFAMDTVMNVKIIGGDDNLLKQIEDQINGLENMFSTTQAGSDIYMLNQNGQATVGKDTEILLNKALQLCAKTNGALDVSIYPIVTAWGFTTGEYQVPEPAKINQLLAKVDYRKITQNQAVVSLEENMKIDLGSVAKGYTADKIVEFLKENQIDSALLNLGGNVHALGSKSDGSPWRIAIQDPKGDNILGVVSVSDLAVVTSGGYERYFEDNGKLYWHIMDPKTGYPASSGLISVSIICPSGLYADALSTSLFIKGLEESTAFWRKHRDFEAVFVDEASNIYITEGLENIFALINSDDNQKLKIIKGQP